MEQIKESLSVLFISPLRDEYARLLWCIFIAVLLCGAYLFYRRVTVCRALKSLLEKECFSEETAKTAEELGIKKESDLTADAHLVKKVGEKPSRFYLPETLRKKAEYMQKAGNVKWWQAVGGILALYLVLVVIYHILPTLLGQF